MPAKLSKGYSTRQVFGVGPLPCDILILGEAPGMFEDKVGKPFVGKTGQELDDLYLPIIHCKRSNVRIDNIIQFRPAGNRTPSDSELTTAIPDVVARIDNVDPKYILALGYCANFVLSNGQPVSMEKIHGRAYRSEITNAIVIPCYHPAAGLRRGKDMTYCIEDFEAAWEYMNGKKLPEPAVKSTYDISVIESPGQLHGTLMGVTAVAIDTEDVGGKPWSIQFAVRNGSLKGYWINAVNKILVDEFLSLLDQYTPDLVFHHAIHDIAVLSQLGFVPSKYRGKVRDTMVKAKHMGNQPLGLKALAYRWLGEEMDAYLDVVRPGQNALSIKYLRQALKLEWPDLPKRSIWDKQPGAMWETKRSYQPRNIGKRIEALVWKYEGYPNEWVQVKVNEYRKKLIRSLLQLRSVKRDQIDRLWVESGLASSSEANRGIEDIKLKYAGNKSIDLYKRWKDMRHKRQVTDKFGTMIEASLADIPFKDALDYSVRDALNTLRLDELMERSKP